MGGLGGGAKSGFLQVALGVFFTILRPALELGQPITKGTLAILVGQHLMVILTMFFFVVDVPISSLIPSVYILYPQPMSLALT